MKKLLLYSLATVAVISTNEIKTHAQTVQVTNGPELNNDPEQRMNRMFDGDANSFFSTRVKTKGKGATFILEKIDKKTLKQISAKEVDLGKEDVALIDVINANNNFYLVLREYTENKKNIKLFVQPIKSEGLSTTSRVEIMNAEIKKNFSYNDFFTVAINPSKTKFVVKSTSHEYKEPGFSPLKTKITNYNTDFTCVNLKDLKVEWTKTTTRANGFDAIVGMNLDNSDNLYFAYRIREVEIDENIYSLNLGILEANAPQERGIKMPLELRYFVRDVHLTKSDDNKIVMAGFMRDNILHGAKDSLQCGIFRFVIDLNEYKLAAQTISLYDSKLLDDLDFHSEATFQKIKFYDMETKMDHVYQIGDDIFYVGEVYWTQPSSQATRKGYGNFNSKNIVIAKFSSKGEFDWIANAPLREIKVTFFLHDIHPYMTVVTEKKIYVFNNEDADNMRLFEKGGYDSKEFQVNSKIKGSNFVYSTVSTQSGIVTHKLLFKNETYCYTPVFEPSPEFVPLGDAELIVPVKPDEYIFYTEDNGKGRYNKMKIVD